VATVSEVLRSVRQGFVVLAGPAGLGREVRRVVHIRPANEPLAPVGNGDLIVYGATERRANGCTGPDRTLAALMHAGVAGVLTDLQPTAAEVQAAESCHAPLLASIGGIETEQLCATLSRALVFSQAVLEAQQDELERELSDLSRSGATPSLLLDRLVETTGKAGVLHAADGRVKQVRQAVLQHLEETTIRRAADATRAAVAVWLADSADATANTTLYLELPSERLVRLVGPVWVDGQVHSGISLLARADELTGRDRVAVLAAARALSGVLSTETPEIVDGTGRRRCAAVVVRAPDATLEDLADAVRVDVDLSRSVVTVGAEDVRVVMACDMLDHWAWQRRVIDWHARLSSAIGSTVSMGYAIRHGPASSEARYALVQAAEAALVGDHLFGPGHVISYADAQLARFMLGGRKPSELRAVYETALGKLAAEDLKRERELVATLEAYCETLSTQRTAERLQVHRNTVLYRLRRIQEITAVDLDDAAGRLVLQLGVLAGRLASAC
jgi:purine catabolism regulator